MLVTASVVLHMVTTLGHFLSEIFHTRNVGYYIVDANPQYMTLDVQEAKCDIFLFKKHVHVEFQCSLSRTLDSKGNAHPKT